MKPSVLLCNPDVEARLAAIPPAGQRAKDHAHAVARLFALCGLPGSRLVLAVGDARHELDGDALREGARRAGFYNEDTVLRAPWSEGLSTLLAYGLDDRCAAFGVTADANKLRQLHSKVWSHALARHLDVEPPPFDRARMVASAGELSAHLSGLPDELAGRWTLKPLLGFAGGGRIAGRGRTFSDDTARILGRTLARDGAMLFEPWVDRDLDVSAQLWIAATGEVSVLAATHLLNSTAGRYRGSGSWHDEPVARAISDVAMQVGRALAREGYAGPAGVDAFVFRWNGCQVVRPLVEVNPRFTLGLLAAHVASMRSGGPSPWQMRFEPSGQPWGWFSST